MAPLGCLSHLWHPWANHAFALFICAFVLGLLSRTNPPVFFKCSHNGGEIYYWFRQQKKIIVSLKEDGTEEEMATFLLLIPEWNFRRAASIGEKWLRKSIKASLLFERGHWLTKVSSQTRRYSCSMRNPARLQNANQVIISVLGLFLFPFFACKR